MDFPDVEVFNQQMGKKLNEMKKDLERKVKECEVLEQRANNLLEATKPINEDVKNGRYIPSPLSTIYSHDIEKIDNLFAMNNVELKKQFQNYQDAIKEKTQRHEANLLNALK